MTTLLWPVGAGVLPYAVKENGSIELLFHIASSGKKSGRLVDFGGHVEAKDESAAVSGVSDRIAVGAARELWEETNGAIKVPAEEVMRGIRVEGLFNYTLFIVRIPFESPSAIESRMQQSLPNVPTSGETFNKRRLIWVPLQDVLSGTTTLPIFERMSYLPKFMSTLQTL